jgi:hypothetical protein
VGFNPKQFKKFVSQTLQHIPKGYSESSLVAALMCAAHESKLGEYLYQENGPALGVFQIEPTTHDTIWEHGDTCCENAQLMGIEWSESALVYDLRYQVFMFRQRLFMKPEALPPADDLMAMAMYLKKHWNTVHGKAKAHDYYLDYLEFYGDL